MSGKFNFIIDIPPWEALTKEQQEAPDGYPIYIGYPSWDDAVAHAKVLVAATQTESVPVETKDLAEEVADRVVEKTMGRKDGKRKEGPSPDARLMTIEDFASTVGFGKRKVEQFVAEGMPTVGDRRSRRVLVKEAQEWVIRRLQDDGSDVLHRARADASKRRAG